MMCHAALDAVIRQQEETPISRPVKANDPAVRGKEVRLVGPDNQQFGIVPVDDAIAKAEEASMDLVLVADRATPPVCRIMNFGKHQYEQKRKMRDQRKKQVTQKNKEIKFHANIDQHDYDIKLNRIVAFLKKGNRVKVSLFFRGREVTHRDIGMLLMERVAEEIEVYGVAENRPRMIGRSIVMFLNPNSAK
jgi:translation initiation factor IF-3